MSRKLPESLELEAVQSSDIYDLEALKKDREDLTPLEQALLSMYDDKIDDLEIAADDKIADSVESLANDLSLELKRLSDEREAPTPSDPAESDLPKKVFASLATLAGNAFVKQIGGIMKAVIDGMASDNTKGAYQELSDYIKSNGGPVKALLKGYQFRFVSAVISMAPAREVALLVRSFMEEYNKTARIKIPTDVAVVATAATTETILAAPFEAKSLVNALSKAGATPNLYVVYKASWIASLGYATRNSLTWAGALLAPGGRQLSVPERAALGLFCGMISAIPDTVGNMMLKESLNHPTDDMASVFAKSLRYVIDQFRENPVKFFKEKILLGAGLRGFAGAFGAVLLSSHGVNAAKDIYDVLKKSPEAICDSLNSLFSGLSKKSGETLPKITDSDVESVKKITSDIMVKSEVRALRAFSEESDAIDMARGAAEVLQKLRLYLHRQYLKALLQPEAIDPNQQP